MYKISQLAEEFGLSRSTLLYYDRIGLLSPSARTQSDYRLYSPSDRKRLSAICSLRQAGLGVKDIRTILASVPDDTSIVIQRRLSEVGDEIRALQIKQRLLAGMLKARGEGGPESTVNKEMFVAMLRAAGMDDAAMKRLHAEFERRAPEAHHAFLLSLGIPEKEALLIRSWSADFDRDADGRSNIVKGKDCPMDSFLRSTEYIDWQHHAVQAKARELAAGATDKADIVRRCFEFVRDEIRHSWDFRLNPVTYRASEVLEHGTGYCYAKSHLLAALLRANGIPAGLCYQRLSRGDGGPPYCLHGLNAVYLEEYGWYRIDARGNKPGVQAEFCPPVERLAFPVLGPDEADLPDILPEPLAVVVKVLTEHATVEEVYENLPDVELRNCR